MKYAWAFLILPLLAACEAPGPAPIRDGRPPVKESKPAYTVTAVEPDQNGQHVVQKGDTLFAIAFQNGLDYRDLAFWNNLSSPDVIKVGQTLRLTPPDDVAGRARGVETIPLRENSLTRPKPIQEVSLLTEPRAQRLPYSDANWAAMANNKPAPTEATRVTQPAQPTPNVSTAPVSQGEQEDWLWPAGGPLLGNFGQAGGKGIDIAGEPRSPVIASGPGKVVYSGNGLRGYGKLLIVKHSGEFLTAYAHNHALLVKEGDWVKAGQKIAEMGDTDSDRVKLHFEIRQYGKPLDPLKYLPERK